ncbi:hypothetical protein D3C80_1527150 [compost metagenome]
MLLVVQLDKSLCFIIFRIVKPRLEPVLTDIALNCGQSPVLHPYRIFIVLHRIDEQLIMVPAEGYDIPLPLLHKSLHLFDDLFAFVTAVTIITEQNQLILRGHIFHFFQQFIKFIITAMDIANHQFPHSSNPSQPASYMYLPPHLIIPIR